MELHDRHPAEGHNVVLDILDLWILRTKNFIKEQPNEDPAARTWVVKGLIAGTEFCHWNPRLTNALHGLAQEVARHPAPANPMTARHYLWMIESEVAFIRAHIEPPCTPRSARTIEYAAWILPRSERHRWVEEMQRQLADVNGRKAQAQFLWRTITRMPRLACVLRDPRPRAAGQGYQAVVAVLESEARTLGVLALVVVGLCGWSMGEDGLDGLLANSKPIGGMAVLLYGAVIFARRKLDVKVHKRERTPEADDES